MYKLLLCSRYLRTRYIALASIVSVMLGVATMIVVNSVMAGFATEMRTRIHGILADIVIEVIGTDGAYDFEEHRAKALAATGSDIAAMSATVEIYGMLSFQYAGQWITRPVTLIGIDPESKSKVGTLAEHLASYQPTRDEDGQVIGPPQRSADEPPDWDLAESYLAYRRLRVEQQRWLNQHQDHHGGDEPAEGAEQNPFDELATETEPAAIDPASPLPGRIYVGESLVSYQHEVRTPGSEQVTLKTVMMVQPGDDLKLSTVSSGRPPQAVHFNATLVDTFKSGMSEYDANLVFVNLEHLQAMRGMIDPSTGKRAFNTIQVKLKDYSKADQVVQKLRTAFPPGLYTIRTWEQKQGPLLAAVAVESAILNVLLFLIIAVAGFGILAIFFMIVVEKTRDIGILKALGASSNGVLSIFISYGFALGIVGAGVGVLLGLGFVAYINEIEALLTKITGQKVFDERIYYFPKIPTHTHPFMVCWVAMGAIVIAVLASVLPARRASQLHPVEALRYE